MFQGGNLLLGQNNVLANDASSTAGFGVGNVLWGTNAFAFGLDNNVKAGTSSGALNSSGAQAFGVLNVVDATNSGSYSSGSSNPYYRIFAKAAIGVRNTIKKTTPDYGYSTDETCDLAFGLNNTMEGTLASWSSTDFKHATILIGKNNSSSQTRVFAMGIGHDLKVEGEDVMVLGRFNDPTCNPNSIANKTYIYSQQGPMLVIGNGGYDYYRYNIVVINKNGTIEINGDTTFDGKIKTKKAYGGISMGEFGKPAE